MKLYAFADEAASEMNEQIEAMLRNRLDGLEIRGVDGSNILNITEEKAQEIRKKLDDAGLRVWSIGSPIGKISIEDADYDSHLQKYRYALKLAGILGAENIRLFSFYMPQGEAPERYRDVVISRMKQFVEIAADSGVTVCHENEKGIYGDVASRCLELHQAIPELKGIFDPANFVQCGQDTLQAWDMLRPHIKYLHIKDAMLDGSVVPAGEGVGNVAKILKCFTEQGGNALTVEPHLTVFEGFAALEQSGNGSEVGKFVYPSNHAAFDAACDALKKLL